MFLIPILTIDSSGTGRFNRDDLSDQAMMELLIDGLPESQKELFQDDAGEFKDISEWPIVEIEDDEVAEVEIREDDGEYSGTLPFKFIPTSARRVWVSETSLTGTLDTSCLSPNLLDFQLCENEFHGSIDLTALPASLESFDVNLNKFTGSCDLTRLTASLQHLDLSENAFSGTVDLTSLPAKMESLRLSENDFCGELSFDALPGALRWFDISDNAFCGSVQLGRKLDLEQFSALNNRFEGTAVVFDMGDDELVSVTLDGNKLVAVVNPDGEKHEMEDWILCG